MAQRDLLKGGRRALDRIMTCGVRIAWDESGSADDDFDYVTGRVLKPLNDEEIIYDEWSIGDGGRTLKHESGLGGRALVSPVSAVTAARMRASGGVPMTGTPYEIHIPLDAPEVGNNAVVEVVASPFPFSDPLLLDRQFLIRTVETGSLLPARKFIAEERVRTPS